MYVIWLTIFFVHSWTSALIPLEDDVNDVQYCINNILNRHLHPKDYLMYINLNPTSFEIRVQQPHLSYNTLTDLKKYGYNNLNFYLIISNEMEDTFKFLSETQSWNPRAKFLLIEKYFRNTHDTARKYYVFNTAIFQINDDGPNRICHEDNLKNMFEKKVTELSTTLRISLLDKPPFVVNPEKNGVEQNLLNLIQRVSGIKIQYVTPQISTNSSYYNESHLVLYDLLYRNLTDAVIGGIWLSNNLRSYSDYLYPYIVDNLVWIVPSYTVSNALITVHFYEYVVVLICILSFSFILYYSSSKHSYEKYFKCLLSSCQCLLNQPIVNVPLSSAPRIVFGFFLLGSLVLNSVNHGTLTTSYRFVGYDTNMKTIKNLIQSNMSFGFADEFKSMFLNDNIIPSSISSNLKYCPIRKVCYDKVIDSHDFAFLDTKSAFEYYRLKWYSHQPNKGLTILQERAKKTLITGKFKKGHPLFKNFSVIFRRLQWHGFISYEIRNFKTNLDRFMKLAKEKVVVHKIKTQNSQTIFTCYICGLLLSLICFFFEVLYYYYLESVLLKIKKILKNKLIFN
ncbi:hypothetical protein FQR65_LT06221 [Abscondita terminalis]|nr:hypothetical protein FQR65_LT06221 [Abscondita terminalis]